MAIGIAARYTTAVTRWYRWYMFVGAMLLTAGVWFGEFGVISGVMAVWFGACSGAFAGRQSERGIGMLSAVFLAITALFGALAGYGIAGDVIERRLGIADVVEIGIAAALLLMQVLLLVAVIYLSLRSRPPARGEMSGQRTGPDAAGDSAGRED